MDIHQLLTPEDLTALRANKPVILRQLESGAIRLVCFACKERRFWLSTHGATICAKCHPPGSPKLVARWIDGDEDQP